MNLRVPKPLHRRLWVVVAAALVPTAGLSGVALVLLQHDQKQDVARATIETMRAMVSTVDGELSNKVALTQALAASTALDSGDLATFYEEARRVTQAEQHWVTIALSDRTGQQLLNVLKPLDAPLDTYAERASFKRVVKTGKPAVGDLARSNSDGSRGFAIRVPVVRDGKVTYVLTGIVAPEAMLAVIRRQKVPSDGVVSILDSLGQHVARSRAHERYLGHPTSKILQAMMKGRNEGWGSSITLEGQETYAAFSRSTQTGWSVAVGIPQNEIDASVRRSFGTLGLGLLLSIAVGALASLMMARLVTKPISELRRAAQAVGRGEVPDVEPMRIAEINEVARALVGAAEARKQAENASEELLERERIARAAAESASRSKDEFLAMLGHELRNPLSAISSAASVIDAQQRPGETTGTQRAQRVIVRQVEHLARLVDDLLDVARVVSGKVILEREDVNLAEVVKHSIATLEAGGHLDHHQVKVDTDHVWAHADPTRIQQVVNNLVINAVKYTPKQGHIWIRVHKSKGDALLEVRDDGVGINPELMGQVFELFSQGEQALDRSQGGLGIGLTLVRRLVELHDGTVSATSPGLGQGSVFTVKLPTITEPESEDSVPEAPKPDGCRVVIVEDNHDSREMLRDLLQLQGHHVETAADGPEGFERVLSEKPQVALIDLGLPGYDGYELARRIRSKLGKDEVMLVALSGYGSRRDKQRSRGAGFDVHLVKPINGEKLSQVLSRAIQG